MPKGTMIIIESGSDASGKATQTSLLYEALVLEGRKIQKITYPNYSSPASALVKMYLAGEFGANPEDVNAYAASIFYAIDRFASFQSDWKEFYEAGGIVLSDRYTTSNMVHQSVKLHEDRQDAFLSWLMDLEYDKLGLPQPDCVIFLDVEPETSQRLMEGRVNKITGEDQKDIHERDKDYLANAYANSLKIAEKFGWIRIRCTNENGLRSIEDIHKEILAEVRRYLWTR